jgi:hypothetical protein
MSWIYAGKRVLRTSSGASMATVGPEWLVGDRKKMTKKYEKASVNCGKARIQFEDVGIC